MLVKPLTISMWVAASELITMWLAAIIVWQLDSYIMVSDVLYT